MIKIIFPQGCYGTFLSRCVFEFTDLTKKNCPHVSDITFEFDVTGSSHSFRQNIESQKHIISGHLPGFSYDQSDTIIAIIPCKENFLDYFDNQFIKNEYRQIISYLRTMFSPEEIRQKLIDGWNYNHDLDSTTPRWLLREWCSFWLESCLSNSYDIESYSVLPAKAHIETRELFQDLYNVLQTISKALDLRLLATISQIKELQSKFVEAQTLHDIQNRCDAWVNKILDHADAPSPCLTLFDEAWVQHRLRFFGYEIQCDGLEQFPISSKELSKLIYNNI